MTGLLRFLCFLSIFTDDFGLIFGPASFVIKLTLILALLIFTFFNGACRDIYIVLLFLGVPLFYHFATRPTGIVTEISWFFRVILVMLIIDKSVLFITKRFIIQYFRVLYSSLVCTIWASYFLSMGRPMYGNEGVGTRGFYIAGNELSFLLLVATIFILYDLVKLRRYWGFSIISLMSVATAVMLATKVAFIGVIFAIIIFLTSAILKSLDMKRLSIRKKEFYLSIPFLTGFLFVVPLAVEILLEKVGLIERLNYALAKFDILTVIMSGRNLHVTKLVEYYNLDDMLALLFGIGELEMISLLGQTTETDFFDYFGFFGLFGLIGFITYVFYLFQMFKNDATKIAIFILFILISSVAGHVFSSGVAAIPLALLSIYFYYENSNNYRSTSPNY